MLRVLTSALVLIVAATVHAQPAVDAKAAKADAKAAKADVKAAGGADETGARRRMRLRKKQHAKHERERARVEAAQPPLSAARSELRNANKQMRQAFRDKQEVEDEIGDATPTAAQQAALDAATTTYNNAIDARKAVLVKYKAEFAAEQTTPDVRRLPPPN